MKRIALFASGVGTNALNLLAESKKYPNIEISCLIVDTESSPLPEVLAQKYPDLYVHRILPDETLKGLDRKSEHEERILSCLEFYDVEWILLTGYMRLIGEKLLTAFTERIINIHPSLLPLYPGLDAYKHAFEDKVKESGITIHLVDAGVDTGPILLQEKFKLLESDSLSDFTQRGKDLEWRLYPEILKKLNNFAKLLPGE